MASFIRLVADSDVAAIAALYRPIVESTAISFETDPPTPDEMRRRISDTLPSYPWLVYDVAGRVAGYAYATRHRVRAAYQWSVDRRSTSIPIFDVTASGAGSTRRCSGYSPRRGTSTRSPASRCRILRAWPFTSRSDSRRSACIGSRLQARRLARRRMVAVGAQAARDLPAATAGSSRDSGSARLGSVADARDIRNPRQRGVSGPHVTDSVLLTSPDPSAS